MTIIPVVGIKFISEDGVSFFVKEGDALDKVVYKEGGEIKTLTGACRVINVSTKAYNAGPTTCPPDPFFKDVAKINGIIFDISDEFNAKLKSIPVEDIMSINIAEESDVKVDLNNPEGGTIADALAIADAGAAISLSEGSVTEAVSVTKSVKIEGTNSGVPQNRAQEV
jgi:hypothetical protein